MVVLTIEHLKAFEAKLIDIVLSYDLSGREDFDIAYSKNLSSDRLTLDEVEFKKDLKALRQISLKKEEEYRDSMRALKEAIAEAHRQIRIDSDVSTALSLINQGKEK